MARKTRITRRGIIWIPRVHSINWKVLINTTNITADLLKCECTLAATEEIGSFKIELDNNSEEYTGKWSGGETVKIYLDFADATTEVFRGYIERIKNIHGGKGYILEITGRHVAGELLDITVTESYSNKRIDDILKDIVTKYATGFTYNKATYPCSIKATVNWSHKPFWECVIDLCNLASYDCYVNNAKALIFFSEGSILNTKEAAIWNDTLLSVEGLGEDTVDVKNKIIVYGEDDEGMPIIYTAEDAASQAAYNIKERIIKDADIRTMNEAKERAEAELALLKQPETRGKVKTILAPGLNPGEMMWISNPVQKIHGIYKIIKFTHKILEDVTICVVERERILPHVFKKRMARELALEEILNPFKLKYSYNFTFDDDTQVESHSNTQTLDGSLQLIPGETSGTMISKAKIAEINISKTELRLIGQDLAISRFWISVDNGISWESVTENTLHTVTGTGKKLKVKVQLRSDSANPKPLIRSLAILFA